ncbi:MAG: serine/threonine-protein kinase [Bacteroidota bacterium]
MSPDPSPDRWARVADVFDAVADLDAEERAAALDRLCRQPDGTPDPSLREEVESLLDADQVAATEPTFEVAEAAVLLDDEGSAEGERIGPWRVIREIGRGGMGRVDLVERADGAYDQRAALKRLGLVAPRRIRRFLRERQILASLRHPGIARLLDGGVDNGAPYLVMEYAEGDPITTYADRRGLGLRDRLALFVDVCEAVAYAHQRLVVHRDLKPSNVLVGDPGDGASPRVTLLDFGVARLLDPEIEDPITAEGPGAPLTPGYAAPEQIDGGDITTATDVWALGVLLYELVTGRLPFPTHSRSAWVEAVRRAAPTLPSEVVKTASASGTTTPPADAHRVRGDLDAICLAALRTEPENRYASASELRADVNRYLDGLPVEARRPSAGYRIRRFVGRHRVGVAATVAAVAVAVLGTAFYTVRLADERDKAEQAARQAERSALQAERTSEFLESLFADPDPTGADPGERTALDLLDEGAGRLRIDLAAEPVVLAGMLTTVGRVYRTLGRFEESDATIADAVELYEQSPDDPLGHRDALLQLANVRVRTQSYDGAEQTVRAALVLDSLHATPETSERGAILNTLAIVLDETGRTEPAIAAYEEAIALRRDMGGPDAEIDLAANLSNLADALLDVGRAQESLGYFDESLALVEKNRGTDHPYVAFALHLRSSAHERLGDLDQSLADERRALSIGEAALGPEHPFVAEVQSEIRRLEGRRDSLGP